LCGDENLVSWAGSGAQNGRSIKREGRFCIAMYFGEEERAGADLVAGRQEPAHYHKRRMTLSFIFFRARSFSERQNAHLESRSPQPRGMLSGAFDRHSLSGNVIPLTPRQNDYNSSQCGISPLAFVIPASTTTIIQINRLRVKSLDPIKKL
jgi:hypothetical protein